MINNIIRGVAWKEMNEKLVDRLIGRYCKIVTKEPGEDKAKVVSGIINEIDHEAGFLMIESSLGVGCLNLKTIVAIKPKKNPNSNE